MTVQGSAPTDAWVLRSIISPQSQMPREDAFCMMTTFYQEEPYRFKKSIWMSGSVPTQSSENQFTTKIPNDRRVEFRA
jgi:hypothetical protein